MILKGGCFCGAVRFVAEGEPVMRAMCFCRDCQHIAGGGANPVIGMPLDGFRIEQGSPSRYGRPNVENAAVRSFCPTCGTHMLTYSPRRPDLVLIKAGSLDEPEQFGLPGAAIHLSEAQAWHAVPKGIARFEKWAS